MAVRSEWSRLQSEASCLSAEPDARDVFNGSVSGPVEVASVTAHSTEQALPQQGRPQLRVMWDADSVPYRAPLLAALLQELPGAQVRMRTSHLTWIRGVHHYAPPLLETHARLLLIHIFECARAGAIHI